MIALILARGGSKGLPQKNTLPFQGKPLIAHTIEAALESRSIHRLIVSTDDAGIAEVSRSFGAEVPFMRPAQLASDTASAKDAMLHAIGWLAEQGIELPAFCLLQPTSPLRDAVDIDNAWDLFKRNQADSVLSISEYDHPVQWAVAKSKDGHLSSRENNPECRRQDLETFFRPNGAIYIFKTSFFKTCEDDYIGENSHGYLMPFERSLDIDTQLDFIIAETIAKYLEESENVIE